MPTRSSGENDSRIAVLETEVKHDKAAHVTFHAELDQMWSALRKTRDTVAGLEKKAVATSTGIVISAAVAAAVMSGFISLVVGLLLFYLTRGTP